MSLKYLASANAVATFANSEGCKLKKPRSYHEVAPAIVLPNTKRPNREAIESKYNTLENRS